MKALGVDPGLRHTGWCVIEDGPVRVLAKGTIIPPGSTQPEVVIPFVLKELRNVWATHGIGAVVVEQVTWYGKGRRITLPLSHVAGAVSGFFLGKRLPVSLVLPAMKKRIKKKPFRFSGAGWTEHAKDAALLALLAFLPPDEVLVRRTMRP